MTEPLPHPRSDSSPNTGTTSAVLAGFLGWTLDAFDYFLVVVCLTDIGREFHKTDRQMSVALLLTLAFRPIGALIFGLLADRFGRRLPLMIDLVFYSIIEILTGLSHTFTQFLVLRALFGIGMGGEWGVGASLAMEKVPPRWRGILSGLLQEGYAVGNLLAGLSYRFLFPHLGWRPMFFLGGLPALLALFVRFGVRESEVWEQQAKKDWSAISTTVRSHLGLFFYLVLLMTMMNFSSHGTQDMYPTLLKRDWHFTPSQVGNMTALTMIGAIFGGVFFGIFSDWIGRRKAMLIAFSLAICTIPLAFSHALVLLILGGFLLQFMVQGAWGIIPAHITELTPNSVRGFLPGFAYQCGSMIAGLVVYAEAHGANHSTYARSMAASALLIFAGAIVVVAFGRENTGARFQETA
jgi:SHS family lactate transporter-like MFS transporter